MSDNPALDALVRDKIAKVEADMKARYGHALEEYFFNGVFDPILREIGYDGSEVQMSEFGGLGDIIDETRKLADAHTKKTPASP